SESPSLMLTPSETNTRIREDPVDCDPGMLSKSTSNEVWLSRTPMSAQVLPPSIEYWTVAPAWVPLGMVQDMVCLPDTSGKPEMAPGDPVGGTPPSTICPSTAEVGSSMTIFAAPGVNGTSSENWSGAGLLLLT